MDCDISMKGMDFSFVLKGKCSKEIINLQK